MSTPTLDLSTLNTVRKDMREFFKKEAAGGILLFITAFCALVIANSPLNVLYGSLIDLPFGIRLGDFKIDKPLLLWVNDGLMAVFFFLVGLELKREFVEGELSSVKKIILPAIGAIGGIAAPALIYAYFNYHDPVAINGWAIPAATDIAFALGVLALLGNRVPFSLKVLLTSMAIFDDIGAIVIIAIFYTSKLSMTALSIAAASCVILFILNRRGVVAKSIYLTVGLVMWTALLKSGVHATLAGVVLAFFIPMSDKKNPDRSPLKTLEHDLHYTVALFIIPIFAFCNAGVNLSGVGPQQLLHSVPLGIAAGLFFGKQIGIFSLCWLGIKLKLADMPEGATWLSLYGIAVLCGIGFTMSLFIGSLAFEETGVNMLFDERIGIMVGSLLSGIWGYIILRYATHGRVSKEDAIKESANA